MSDEERYGRNVAGQLDDNVSAEIQLQLRAARQRAVAVADQTSTFSPLLRLLPASGVVAAGLLAVVLLREPALQPMPRIDAFEMEAAADIELLDDLALLAWLEEQELEAG